MNLKKIFEFEKLARFAFVFGLKKAFDSLDGKCIIKVLESMWIW